MDIIECIHYLRDTGVDVSDAEREVVLIKSALDSADNALTDYVEKFEKSGATMGYGRAVIATVRGARLLL